jgi:hypothetical protein
MDESQFVHQFASQMKSWCLVLVIMNKSFVKIPMQLFV